ncbi:MAG: hypothetical protein ABIR24_14875 [Verrucomicrobiota bacterium]
MEVSLSETPVRIEPRTQLEQFIGRRVELQGTVSDDRVPQMQGVDLRGLERFRGKQVLVSGVLRRSDERDQGTTYRLEYLSYGYAE